MKKTLRHVAEALRNANGRATLFIGAGCSFTAGIPLASGIVKDIATRFPTHHRDALLKTRQRIGYENAEFASYGDCMKEMPSGPIRDLFRGYIDKAKINWAHVGIGALVKGNIVDRVLTTNFDPLIARGCALLNAFPATYDMTMAGIGYAGGQMGNLPDQAVFHLHGQRNGFRMLNEGEELTQQRKTLADVFSDARDRRV